MCIYIYIYIYLLISFFFLKIRLLLEYKRRVIIDYTSGSPVGWGCKIRRQHLCRRVRRSPTMNVLSV